MKFTATCPPGLVDLLARELEQCGADRIQPATTSVGFQGELEVAYRACLWSRIANRILLPITDVPADDPKALYAAAREIRWERHLDAAGTLAVEVAGSGEGIAHSRYAALTLKDAVVDRFRELFGVRPSIDTERPDIRLHLLLRGDRAKLSLDLSGTSLHQRGYRDSGARAPLKENLAAGLLLLADWPLLAAQGAALFDPLCGSGTLLSEGAMMAADIAPGLLRQHFGFLRWKRHQPEIWSALLEEAAHRRRAGMERLPPVIGSDQDAQALQAAERNLAALGLMGQVQLQQRSLHAEMPLPPQDHGLLITNPPYGARLGEAEQLRPLYVTLGQLIRERMPGWQGAVFTGNPELAAQIGLKPQRVIALDNGGIPCRLLLYPATTTHAVAGEPGAELSEGGRALLNRLQKNRRHLQRWAARSAVSCYRVYDQDLPEYAIAVDSYRSGDQEWLHVQEYRAPTSVDAERAAMRLAEAMALLPQALVVPRERIFLKVRERQRGGAQYQKQAQAGRFLEVEEYGARLLVNLSDYLDTGLFLDHRAMRARLRAEATGKRFLNLFCYTASATVQAALGGARSSLSIDLSRTYLDWAGRNLALNGFAPPWHQLLQADVMEWLDAQADGQRFDLIFCDPPTISRSKRMEGSLDVQRDHVRMIRGAMARLAPGGVLYFSNNFRRFKLDEPALADLQIEEISGRTIDEDFRRRPNIHRCWRITT